MTFKTQQEIWLHLAQGGAVQHTTYRHYIIRFVDGYIDAGDQTTGWCFEEPNRWQPYIELPRKVQRTFYRRKWYMTKADNRLYDRITFFPSREEFDTAYRIPNNYQVWSDEWEEITIELLAG